MPSNRGYYRRKSLKEEALVRRLANIETYREDETKADKLRKAEDDVAHLNHNIQLSKKGRNW